LDTTLGLAVTHGWEPVGTLEPSYWEDPSFYDDTPEFRKFAEGWGYRLPGSYRAGGAFAYEPQPWGGHYRPPQGQVVTGEDAAAMAAALRRAVDSLADYGAHLERVLEADIADEEEKVRDVCYGKPPAWARDHATGTVVARRLSEKELLELVAFCGQGEFVMW
jgi:hypothetical protein